MNKRLCSILGAAVLGAWSVLALNFAMDHHDVVHHWPRLALALFVASLPIGIAGGVMLGAYGLGIFGTGDLPSIGESRPITAEMLVAVYLGSFSAIMLTFAVLWMVLGISIPRAFGMTIGPLFLLICAKRPWWLFATVRRTGWFPGLQDDRPIQAIFGVGGVAAVLLGMFAR